MDWKCFFAGLLLVYGISNMFFILAYCIIFDDVKEHWNIKTGNRLLYPYLLSGIASIYFGLQLI